MRTGLTTKKDRAANVRARSSGSAASSASEIDPRVVALVTLANSAPTLLEGASLASSEIADEHDAIEVFGGKGEIVAPSDPRFVVFNKEIAAEVEADERSGLRHHTRGKVST